MQYFPPPADKGQMTRLNEVLVKILTKTEVTKSVNKNNADHGILFEAVNLVINYCYHGYVTQSLPNMMSHVVDDVVTHTGCMITVDLSWCAV